MSLYDLRAKINSLRNKFHSQAEEQMPDINYKKGKEIETSVFYGKVWYFSKRIQDFLEDEYTTTSKRKR